MNNLKITKIYRSGDTRFTRYGFRAKFFEKVALKCVSRYGESIFVAGIYLFRDLWMRRWRLEVDDASFLRLYLSIANISARRRDRSGRILSIRVSAHLLTRFDDRNLSRYKTGDWEKRRAARRRESRIYREVLITSGTRRF